MTLNFVLLLLNVKVFFEFFFYFEKFWFSFWVLILRKKIQLTWALMGFDWFFITEMKLCWNKIKKKRLRTFFGDIYYLNLVKNISWNFQKIQMFNRLWDNNKKIENSLEAFFLFDNYFSEFIGNYCFNFWKYFCIYMVGKQKKLRKLEKFREFRRFFLQFFRTYSKIFAVDSFCKKNTAVY